MIALTIVAGLWGCSAETAADYPCRWVYVSRSLRRDADVDDIRGIVATAAASGLNGMVLAAGLDRLSRQPPDYFDRLKAVDRLCRDRGIELIPIIFSVGYGGSVLGADRNLAAGLPVKAAPFLVKDGAARLASDLAAGIRNGGMEEWEGRRLAGYRFHDRPGEVSFADAEIVHGGRTSLRFEGFGADAHGHARVMQEIAVVPHRCYRVSVWVRTEGMQPEGALRLQVLTPEGRALAPYDPRIPATTEWRRIVTGFNSLEYSTVRLYVGAWGGRSGRFWVDDLAVEEVGLLNVLRRPGTPVTVRGRDSGVVYEEGRDYAPIRDTRLDFRFERESPAIGILPGGRIRDGERLLVDYYHGIAINSSQVTVCMSEPALYDVLRAEAKLLFKHLRPRKILLSMDEIRAGGGCAACAASGKTMAEILGSCITKQVEILRAHDPSLEISIWSDMLDPHHNAHGDYYLVQGDFTGSWPYVPKDLVIVCWYHAKRKESLAFFSSHGFATIAGAYYDGDDLENPKDWLEELARTRGARGIMYTTWRNKYDLLAAFGKLVAGARPSGAGGDGGNRP